MEDFYAQCDPDKENLCLYGNPDGTWEVQLPAEEVPPELPEPALGINFARDGMQVSFFALQHIPLVSIFPCTHMTSATDRVPFDGAEEGLASAGGCSLRCLADGGGVLLRRKVRREGEVRETPASSQRFHRFSRIYFRFVGAQFQPVRAAEPLG